MDVTASDVQAMLARHYERDNGMSFPEIASPCGRRRADLIRLERRAHREMPAETPGAIIGHEIKVTRADLITELRDPEKWEAWRPYVDRWWLVVAHAVLLAGLDLPEEWGVLAPPSGRRTRTMTVVRTAPELPEPDRAAALMRIAKWQDNRLREARVRAAEDRRSIATLRNRVRMVGQAAAGQLRAPDGVSP